MKYFQTFTHWSILKFLSRQLIIIIMHIFQTVGKKYGTYPMVYISNVKTYVWIHASKLSSNGMNHVQEIILLISCMLFTAQSYLFCTQTPFFSPSRFRFWKQPLIKTTFSLDEGLLSIQHDTTYKGGLSS